MCGSALIEDNGYESSGLVFTEPLENRNKTDYIIIHHSGVVGPHTVEDVHQWHQKRGWAGIGYHYFISKEGVVYKGRPSNTIGAHARGYNKNSVGVCFAGDFTKEKMQDKQLSDDVLDLLFFLSYMYGASIVFCDELEGHNPVKGFLKEQIRHQLDTYHENFYNEYLRVSGQNEAQCLYDWIDERCYDFGIPCQS